MFFLDAPDGFSLVDGFVTTTALGVEEGPIEPVDVIDTDLVARHDRSASFPVDSVAQPVLVLPVGERGSVDDDG